MDGITPGEDRTLSENAALADLRIEVVKRELNQGALAGFDSSVTEYAARLVIAALDSFDEDALAAEFRRGFEAGDVNAALIEQAAYRAGRKDAAREIEQPDSILCDCSDCDSSPANPRTLVPMDHHCDCTAVQAAATMLGAFSKTNHGQQCIHGTEMHEFYRSGSEGK